MSLLHHALQSGRASRTGNDPSATTVLVAGGGGALGSAVLELLLGGRKLGHVKVLANRALTATMQGLEAVVIDRLTQPPELEAIAGTGAAPIADTAVIVFDRERHANGRELAFMRPLPEDLPALAKWMRRRGVRRLIVVLPHSRSSLPDALKVGLANLDEHAVAALGFDHLAFVRSAQAPSSVGARQWLQRLADGMLAQMQIMVAPSNQPVRAHKVAQFVVELAARLPSSSPHATLVAPPELVWQAAQMREPASIVQAWLASRELPQVSAPRVRL